MTDLLTGSPMYLARWSGTQVRVHISLILLLVFQPLHAALAKDHPFAQTFATILMLFVALAIHELGHAAMAAAMGGERDEEIRLWPLGNMVSPSVATRATDNVAVALAGPAANLMVVLMTAIGLSFAGAQFAWNPAGHDLDFGAPYLLGPKELAPKLSAVWWVGCFGFVNWMLFLANLIPALPFDGGRALRAVLAGSTVVASGHGMIAPWTAKTSAVVLGIVGLIRLFGGGASDGITLIAIALLIYVYVRSEALMLEDGGFFDDGVFGYDFSEGYTSLEGSAAKVRPYRESALKRWRRRRSELRRQRQQAREAAEDRRMDEILEKLHREGRSALSDEEQRFLVRVSNKYRNRPKARD